MTWRKFLTGWRGRTEDLENAVRIFLEFLRGFESLDIEEPAVTVFGSARFKEIHPFYQLAPLGRSGCFDESQCLLLTRYRPESTG